MTRTFTRPVRRRVDDTIRSGGKSRRVVVTVYPSGALGLRLERTRTEEQILSSTVYAMAVRLRVMGDRAAKKKACVS